MKAEDLMNAVNNISDKHIEEFALVEPKPEKQKNTVVQIFKKIAVFSAAAAALFGIFVVAEKVGFTNTSQTNIPSYSQSDGIKTYETSEKDDNTNLFENNADEKNYGTSNGKTAQSYDYEIKADDSTKKSFLTIKVGTNTAESTDDKYVTMNPEESVKIINNFNPVLSSSEGLGIQFEISSLQNVTLQTDNGHFITWNQNSGQITNYGKIYSSADKFNVFWTLYGGDFEFFKNAEINVLDESNTTIAVIGITANDDNTFSAVLKK